MEPKFWHDRWQKSEIGFHKHETNSLLEKFWDQLGVRSDLKHEIFVPLCGKSLDMRWFLDRGYRVLGIELSALACEAFFSENNLIPKRFLQGRFEVWEAPRIKILQGDFFDLQQNHLINCSAVYDRAALIALPVDMRERYSKHLINVVPRSAPMLLLTTEYDQAKRPGPPFSVGEAEVRALYEPIRQVKLLHTQDAFSPHLPWAQLGLTWLHEKVYCLLDV